MAMAIRPVFCRVRSEKPVVEGNDQSVPVQKVRLTAMASEEGGKIVLQPRVCTLRSYGSDRLGPIRSKYMDGGDEFFSRLSEYIESSKKSQDFEIVSGRLAMMVFAGTVTMELLTGNSLFRKMELEGIIEAFGVCFVAVACAATFAWFSTARNNVGSIFTLRCNTLVNSLIDQIIDGLFYEIDPSDWSDDL